jgi:hypothetical protein
MADTGFVDSAIQCSVRGGADDAAAGIAVSLSR